uniref:tRNA dimethylallyltransferase n=1 Tax=uncultured bacterium CSLF42 TaxID=1091574 RepID=G4WVY7_9BACT|nr:tRNA delta(2)-isopentenylpyrophosphate transferase [uncultured bacterium CSLF42]
MPEILGVVGPTGSGKTSFGLQWARAHRGEIISADSRQLYRYLAIGTAKPAGTWTAAPPCYRVEGIPYHLVDFLNPDERFSAAEFARIAEAKIQEILNRGHTPILVGGTGFYFKALKEGLAPLPKAQPSIREELRALAERKGRPHLHSELAKVDPEAAVAIPANNLHRVIRALEVYRSTGKPISQWHREHAERKASAVAPSRFYRIIGLDPGKEILDQRLEQRCAEMITRGMIEETQEVLAKGYSRDCPALSGLGYPRVVAFLKDELSKQDMLQGLIQDTRQYAKRQRTWFRHQLQVDEWKRL